MPPDAVVRDATIQRVEFTVELIWKTFKAFLALEKIDVRSPKAAMRHAYALGWIDDEQIWLNMLDDRNLCSHAYSESMARQIYERIKEYYPAMERACSKLSGGQSTE